MEYSQYVIEQLRDLTPLSIVVRILLALVLGGVLGVERGRKNRPAGLRTYMLVCMGAALVMMTNQYVAREFGTGDVVRMGAQVISGIGFLGAGTIMVTGKNQIKGITTAAGLWTAACCGLAVGIGFYEGALIGGISILVVMSAMQRIDGLIRRRSKYVELYLEFDNAHLFSELIEYARRHELELFDIQMQKNKFDKEQTTNLILTSRSLGKGRSNEIIHILSDAPGVQYIEEL